MADFVIAQREYYTEGPVDSPAVFKNTGRYADLAFLAHPTGTIMAVEASLDDGATWYVITALGTAFTGGIVFKRFCFKQYRVTASALHVHMNAN